MLLSSKRGKVITYRIRIVLKITLLLSLICSTSCINLKTKKDISNEYYNIANEFLQLDNPSKAYELYLKSLYFNKNNKEAGLNLIISYNKSGKYQEARVYINEIYKPVLNEYNKKLLILLGENYYLAGEYTNAIKIFTDFIAAYPDDKIGYFNLGLTYLKIGENQKGIDNFILSYDKDKTFVPTLFNITSYYFKNKDIAKSVQFITELIAKDPENEIVQYMYAQIAYENKEYEIARDAIKKSIDKKNENIDYLIFAAKIYAKGFDDKKNTLLYIDKALENGLQTSSLSDIAEFNSIRENYKTEYGDLVKKHLAKKNEKSYN